ncbi:MAG: hypothetical protein HY474_01020 [Candidatus Sungbacteria bacterium]|uniref:Photosynthesis system II assembly factor Ycf48/Hcf136-like domain-containing protein n=1 Tax=Candidatus Sungiibacteriota bacterium TaxID=2750080 RepID=A0A933DRC3_9BACT|nr:hypothetical protein [Candidatus Sungbacteria bacterium]
MSLRTTVIIFSVVFLLGLFAIVILPFVLRARPLGRPSTGAAPGRITQGIFRSDDGGSTWEPKAWIESAVGNISEFSVNRLVPDPSNPETLYLLTDGNGLWVSRSRGDLWAPVHDRAAVLEPTANVLAMAVNPSDRREWYVAVFQQNRGRVLRTSDGGETFREIYFTPGERYGVFDLYYDRLRGSLVIATGQGGLLETSDRGLTWRVVRWFADGLVRLLADPSNPANWYVMTPRGSIFRTFDRGGTWTDVTDSLREFSGAFSRQYWTIDRSGTLFAGSRYGLVRSSDNGTTFAAPPLIIPPDALPVRAVAVDPRVPGRIIASAASQLYGSVDGGASWIILTPPSENPITHLLIDAEKSQTLYLVAQP